MIVALTLSHPTFQTNGRRARRRLARWWAKEPSQPLTRPIVRGEVGTPGQHFRSSKTPSVTSTQAQRKIFAISTFRGHFLCSSIIAVTWESNRDSFRQSHPGVLQYTDGVALSSTPMFARAISRRKGSHIKSMHWITSSSQKAPLAGDINQLRGGLQQVNISSKHIISAVHQLSA